jgi:Cytochrome c554 and c-prime
MSARIPFGPKPALGVLLIVFALAIVGWVSVPRTSAARATTSSDSDLPQEKQPPSAEIRVFYGVKSCRNCHLKGFEDPGEDICRGTEIAIWQSEDKHALAYKVLGDERGKRMGRILGVDVQKNDKCLACHSVLVSAQLGYQPGFQKDTNVSPEEGVSCVACHGPDIVVLPGQDRPAKLGWLDTHGSQNRQFRDAWRKLSRDVKQDQWGMTDLWDPAKRTKLCASCHIGNVAEGKEVTHEMYAAGHPPLPGFEVVTFSSQMPRHWQYLREKDKKIVENVMKFHASEVDLEQTNLLAIGGLVAFRENLQLLAGKAATKDWPEFANYSCYACHHDLKSDSWRQKRGYAGKPGRPPMREWSTALVELGLFHAAGNADQATSLVADLQTRLDALQGAFDAQPFGQPEAVKQKAEDLTKWIDAQVKRIQDRIALNENKGGFSRNASGLLLAHWLDLEKRSRPDVKLNGVVKRPVPDFDSARQLAWAYQLLYLETASKHDPKARENLAKGMVADPAWKRLDDYLHLTLPPGQTKLETSFGPGLERIGQYEPGEFFQQLDAVLKKFKSPQ